MVVIDHACLLRPPHQNFLDTALDSVQIFPDDKGKLLMVPDSVSLQDVVLENQGLRRELEIWKAKVTDFNKIIDQTSSQIRSAIWHPLLGHNIHLM